MRLKAFFTSSPKYFLLELNILYVVALYFWATPYMAISSLAYSLFIWGLYFRCRRKMHIILMSAGIFMDVFIVLLLEFQRGAIDTAFGGTLGMFPILHVVFSTLCLFVYIPVLYIGYGMYFGWVSKRFRSLHIYLGLIAFSFRSIGYVLMFSFLL